MSAMLFRLGCRARRGRGRRRVDEGMIGLRVAVLGEGRIARPRILAIFSGAILTKEGCVGDAPGLVRTRASDADHPWLCRTGRGSDDIGHFDGFGEVRVDNRLGEPSLKLSVLGRRLDLGRRQAGAACCEQTKQNRCNSSHGSEDIAQRACTLSQLPVTALCPRPSVHSGEVLGTDPPSIARSTAGLPRWMAQG
jgi:hypothetical protein